MFSFLVDQSLLPIGGSKALYRQLFKCCLAKVNNEIQIGASFIITNFHAIHEITPIETWH